jgi:hypothetical protein
MRRLTTDEKEKRLITIYAAIMFIISCGLIVVFLLWVTGVIKDTTSIHGNAM